VRTIPTTPVAQLLWVAGIVSVLVMIFVSTVAGLVLMAVALVITLVLRLGGLR
jgi:hypothetical protein